MCKEQIRTIILRKIPIRLEDMIQLIIRLGFENFIADRTFGKVEASEAVFAGGVFGLMYELDSTDAGLGHSVSGHAFRLCQIVGVLIAVGLQNIHHIPQHGVCANHKEIGIHGLHLAAIFIGNAK